MKTKQLFKTYLLPFAALCSIVLATVSCSNEDITQKSTGRNNNRDFTTFAAGEPKSRTSMDYATGNFYWEEGDKIYVKDDNNVWQTSNAVDAAHAHSASFMFKVPGKFENSTSYKVYYPGKNGSNNQVNIPAAQTQTEPNTTKHFGESGDCGTADATGTIGGKVFNFQLEHQAAILVFQPYLGNDNKLVSTYLTKIEVSSDNDITDTYTLNPGTGELTGTGSGTMINLTTKNPTPGSANEKGFPLKNSSASITANGAYMLIKPGVHTLKVRYWIKDVVTNVEGTITKILSLFDYKKNTFYDMTANLSMKDYDADHYYMWDAQDQFWKGWEWTKNLSGGQTTLNSQESLNYPKSNSDSRWYNESFPGNGVRNDAQTTLFKLLPNANEMAWYCLKGDPRWDTDKLWTSMRHLYKGGMWLKKKSKITGFTDAHIPDAPSVDLRTQYSHVYNHSLKPGLPSASEIGDYFFLPACGEYTYRWFYDIGWNGCYWSSSAHPEKKTQAYHLSIHLGVADVAINDRNYGFRAQAFSDFGED